MVLELWVRDMSFLPQNKFIPRRFARISCAFFYHVFFFLIYFVCIFGNEEDGDDDDGALSHQLEFSSHLFTQNKRAELSVARGEVTIRLSDFVSSTKEKIY